MMVVIMVSRRDGHDTLLVSLRSSCRNLNGPVAIVYVRIRRETTVRFQESKQPSCARPSSKDGAAKRALLFWDIKAASEVRLSGPTASAALYGESGQRSR